MPGFDDDSSQHFGSQMHTSQLKVTVGQGEGLCGGGRRSEQ